MFFPITQYHLPFTVGTSIVRCTLTFYMLHLSCAVITLFVHHPCIVYYTLVQCKAPLYSVQFTPPLYSVQDNLALVSDEEAFDLKA